MPLYYAPNRELEMYEKLFYYGSIAFAQYPKVHINVMDNMNYSVSVFPHVFKLSEIEELYPIESGYMYPDGSLELGNLIRDVELARLRKADSSCNKLYSQLTQQAGLGIGKGCTNVVFAVINTILQLTKSEFPRQNDTPEIILNLPNYSVYAAQLSQIKKLATAKFVFAQRRNLFLPTAEEIIAMVNDHTVAIVLTYPSNPAQTTYEHKSLTALAEVIQFCQQKGIFLILDNIYQDLIFPSDRRFHEALSLIDHLDYIVKVYGSSKDTPFYSGYRIAYWFGDSRLSEKYKYYVASIENSPDTLSMILFGLNLYCKLLKLRGEDPSLDHFECYFTSGVFGLLFQVDAQLLFERFMRSDLYCKYIARISLSNNIQSEAISLVTNYVKHASCFSDFVNGNIGNVFFLRVNPEYFSLNDDKLFHWILKDAESYVLPGAIFGMPTIDGEAWMRITLIHQPISQILTNLERVEESLKKHRKLYNRLHWK